MVEESGQVGAVGAYGVLGELALSPEMPRVVGEGGREFQRPGLLGHVSTVR
jgi:hypothetical protein